jgi:hypothetical protein
MRQQVLAASAGRDRVTDFVKAAALLLVVVGHSLAWFVTPNGSLDNTLNHAPGLWWLTWALQILPLFFFIAGAGMVNLGKDPSALRFLNRSANLLEPTVLLFVFALFVAVVLRLTAPLSLQHNLGVLMVQLTWFLGAYMLFIALAPILGRHNGVAGIMTLVVAIVVTDWMRVNVNASIGWLNMVFVWGFFALLGTQLAKLRSTPAWRNITAVAICVATAAVLIAYGPYSRALITAKGLPGLSNLAPPSLVLLCAGTAQVFLLILVWPRLDRWLGSDRVWVPVAVFGSRAMQVYLFHMLFLVVMVTPFIAAKNVTQPLSLMWWGQHLLVFALTLTAVLLVSPILRNGSRTFALACARLWPATMQSRFMRMPRGVARSLIALTGVLLLVQSTTGIGDFLVARNVLGVSVYPLATWLLIMGLISVQVSCARAGQKRT